MTVAATKTKAEQALTQSFEAVASRLPGGRAVAEARKAAIGVFSALGLPHRRIEQWKYTDLRSALKEALPPAAGEQAEATAQEIDGALESLAGLDAVRLVFVDGLYRPELSSADAIAGLEMSSFGSALAKSAGRDGEVLSRATAPGQEAVIALNTAFMTDGAVVRIAEGAELAKPLLLVFAVANRQGRLVTTRNIVKLGAGARATIIEAHVALPGAAQAQV